MLKNLSLKQLSPTCRSRSIARSLKPSLWTPGHPGLTGCVSVCCSHAPVVLEAELLVYLLHFLQYTSDHVLNWMSGLYCMKTCIFQSFDNNQSPFRTKEWIQKVKRWRAFTLKRVMEVFWEIHLWHRQIHIVVDCRINRENYLSPEVLCLSTNINGCNTFCMRFKIKALQRVFLLWNICRSRRFLVSYCIVLLFIWVNWGNSHIYGHIQGKAYVKTLFCIS